MKFNDINSENELTLPKEQTLSHLSDCSECEIKCLILICSGKATDKDGNIDENILCSVLGFPIDEIRNSIQFWRGAGVLSLKGSRKTSTENKKAVRKIESPDYTGKEISEIYEKNSELRSLVDECQKVAGKVFNPFEISKIVGLYDYLKLPPEFILTVWSYCAKKGKTVVHYIEKTCYNLYDENVDTFEKLEEYLREKEEFESESGKIRTLFGIGKRAFTEKEKQLIKSWKDTPYELIKEAFDITVNNTGKPSLSYAGKILEKWKAENITSVGMARANSESFRKSNKKGDKSDGSFELSSFETDEFFEQALKKSYESIGKDPDGN